MRLGPRCAPVFVRTPAIIPTMSDHFVRGQTWRLWLLIALAAFALALKTTIALTTYGTNDVTTWERDLAKLETQGAAALYREGISYASADGTRHENQPFIHPPFILNALRAWAVLSALSGLPLRFWLRLSSSLADVSSLILVAKLLPGQSHQKTAALAAMAMCPVSVVISGFHGNTDPVMIAFVLLSIYFLECRRSSWLAGAAIGMALNIKMVPLIFIPAVLLYLPGLRDRLRYTVSAAAVFGLGSLPYLLREPVLIARTMLSYSSKFGLWGFSLFAVIARESTRWSWLSRQYAAGGKFLALAAVLCLSAAMNLRTNKPPLVLQCGAIAFLFLFLTPGFAMQYLAWLVPWVVALGAAPTLLFYAASGVFVVMVYNDWSGGFPWHAANALFRPWEVSHAFLGLVCWLSVLAVLIIYLNRLFAGRGSKQTQQGAGH